MTPREHADLLLRQAADRLQRANDELAAAETEHSLASRRVEQMAGTVECDCPAGTCQPQSNIGRYCWRTGCPIYARDFA